MLILTRKKNESIIINDNIEISIIGIEEGKVKIGINAPKDVKILRSEVLEKLIESNKEALASSVPLAELNQFVKKYFFLLKVFRG